MTPKASWERLSELIESGVPKDIEHYVNGLPVGETALAISRLDDDMRARLVTLLNPDAAADILRDMPEEQAAGVIAEISPTAAAAIVEQLPDDEQADLLGSIELSEASAILNAMPKAEAEHARDLLRYPPETAGGLMTSEYLAYPATFRVGDVIQDIEHHSARYSDYEVQYLYVVDHAGRLTGVLKMRELLLAPRDREISSLMVPGPVSVAVGTQLADLARVFDDTRFVGIPVVDSQGRLKGLLERTALEDARGRQAKNSFLRISGIISGDEFRSSPAWGRILRRLAWLAPNIALNILAASVIALYQDTLQAAIALAVFLPIISDMSGCSGNQAVAVSIRELSLGLIRPSEVARVFLKESYVGLFNGFILGVLLGGVAFVWKGNIYLSLVVALALAANTILSVLIGGSVPLLLRRFRMDPALASGPILTTITDMCGFFLVLWMATTVLDKL